MNRERNQPGQGRDQNPSNPRPGQQQPGQHEEEEEEESGGRREEDEESTSIGQKDRKRDSNPGGDNPDRGGGM